MAATITDDLKEKEKALRPQIEKYSDLFQVDPNLVRAIITQESDFDPTARSKTGAYGFGQFTAVAAKQIQNIAAINPDAADLKTFSKSEADEVDLGIKAVCAMLWWLYYKKFPNVADKKTKLEACLTFYNAGGKASAMVVQAGGFSKALPAIKALDPMYRAQADTYAPAVIEWFIAWHDFIAAEKKTTPPPVPAPAAAPVANPFENQVKADSSKYKALIESLKLLPGQDPGLNISISVREGMTEVTVIFPGEY